MYKIFFYVPDSHLEIVKTALFAAGAGKLGNYDCCAWQVLGEGQFRPLDKAQPFIGQQGKISLIVEYKVEMICSDEFINDALHALKQAHPYEEPVYGVYKLKNLIYKNS